MVLRHALWTLGETALEPMLREEYAYLRSSLHARRTPHDRRLIRYHIAEIRQLKALIG
jgi:hypothetical protein